MGLFDNFGDFWFGSGRGAAQKQLDQGQKAGYGYVGASPYVGDQNALIQQLRAQAEGRGPSLAEAQYRAAENDALAQQLAMSRGRGQGAARTAATQMGNIGQGLASGAGRLRLQEQQGAQGLLQGAISAGETSDFRRAAANQAAYQQALAGMMQQGGIGQSLAGLGAQGLGAYAMLRGPQMQGQGQGPGGTNSGGGTSGFNLDQFMRNGGF